MAADGDLLQPQLQETLPLQLSEIEILSSMFVEEKEFIVDQVAVAETQDYLAGIVTTKPTRLNFCVCLSPILPGQESVDFGKDVLEINCCYPAEYPHKLPDVYMRSNALTRELQRELNESTVSFLSSLERGELCMVTLIQWLQDTWPEFSERSQQVESCKMGMSNENKDSKNEMKLSRMWLYMHHIFNKSKRKNIVDWAVESKLTGFSLPGKPGVVCIEGDEKDTEEYFSRLRKLSWKKITCRHREVGLSESRFRDFQELVFHVRGSGEDHMNMGEFFQYLVKHDLGEMFKVLFGIEGKLNKDP